MGGNMYIQNETDKEFSVLLGKTIVKIDTIKNEIGEISEIIFYCSDNTKYKMYHMLDCCESVVIQDICGELDDIINSKILYADMSSFKPSLDDLEIPDSFTWTFYKIGTFNGWVDIRWFGESNGWYSEEVSFVELE